MQRASEVVGETLGVEVTTVLELLPGGVMLRVAAGTGFGDGVVGRALVHAQDGSHAARVLAAGAEVKVPDFGAADAPRSPLLRDQRVVAGIAVPIESARREAYGVLGAYAREPRAFTEDEVYFLRSIASVLGSAQARVRTEELLRAAEARSAEAQEAVRERDEFISVAAHELRTPLTALQLKLEVLKQGIRRESGEAAEEKVRERLAGAMRQTQRLGSLVERLLDVSRIVGGRLELERADVELTRLTERVVGDFREQAEEAGSELRLSIDGPLHGSWDPVRLEQVLGNLLSNAIKYGPGRPIDVRLERNDGAARLSVQDRGIGISSQDLRRIFGRFERAAPVRHYGGLGLGLYIARHIVEAHGGTITAESVPGEGSTFFVERPERAPPARVVGGAA
jgi:signal transduction histidine kinase